MASALTTTFIITLRKFVSLIVSVYFFKNQFSGACLRTSVLARGGGGHAR